MVHRLRELLDEEERQLVLAARLDRVTPLERQKQMRERAKSLLDAREAQRRQVVEQKLDQQFRWATMKSTAVPRGSTTRGFL